MQKVTSLKRKAEENTEEELDSTRLCKARLDHLKSYASGTVTFVAKSKFRLAFAYYRILSPDCKDDR